MVRRLTFDMRGAQKAQPFGHPLDGRVRRHPRFTSRGQSFVAFEHVCKRLVAIAFDGQQRVVLVPSVAAAVGG
jgi:hypothetical protein